MSRDMILIGLPQAIENLDHRHCRVGPRCRKARQDSQIQDIFISPKRPRPQFLSTLNAFTGGYCTLIAAMAAGTMPLRFRAKEKYRSFRVRVAAGSRWGSMASILIVEDEPDSREALEIFLRH